MTLCATLRREPETVNAPPMAASFAHVKVPVILGLVRMFVFTCTITPPYNAWHVKVPQVRSVVMLNAFAETVLVNAVLARSAFNAKSTVVAFSPKAVNTLVVPLIKLPESVTLTAVAVPGKAGLAIGAF